MEICRNACTGSCFWSRHIALAMVIALSLPGAAGAVEVVPVGKASFKLSHEEAKPGLRVYVQEPMDLKVGGVSGAMGLHWILRPGTYRDERQAVIEGREVVILPVDERLGDKPHAGTGTGMCPTPIDNYIALDIHTGDVLQRGIRRIVECDGKRATLKWQYTVSILEPGNVRVAWGEDIVAAEARVAEDASRREAMADRFSDDATRELKRKIGARICRADEGVEFIGFTEGTSPDSGKIHIRVSDARIGGHAGTRPGGFQPSIIWDEPDNWELCE